MVGVSLSLQEEMDLIGKELHHHSLFPYLFPMFKL
jgi:hypothetical protein